MASSLLLYVVNQKGVLMKVFNQDRKEKILLFIGSIIYLLLVCLNEILFRLEYLFKRFKGLLKFKNKKQRAKYPSQKIFANCSELEVYLPSKTVELTRKDGIQKLVPISIYCTSTSKKTNH